MLLLPYNKKKTLTSIRHNKSHVQTDSVLTDDKYGKIIGIKIIFIDYELSMDFDWSVGDSSGLRDCGVQPVC